MIRNLCIHFAINKINSNFEISRDILGKRIAYDLSKFLVYLEYSIGPSNNLQ